MKYLLTIAIPTYNRAKNLKNRLKELHEQIYLKKIINIEVIISDNCSTDNTNIIVEEYKRKGLNINYIRNKSNIGIDNNFIQCFKLAQGKYILLLGDDDPLINNSIEWLLSILENTDYGLVHIKINEDNFHPKVYINKNTFVYNIAQMITFISANIVNTKFIKQVNLENYSGSYLVQLPLYITAIINSSKNLIIPNKLLGKPEAIFSNSGYDVFDVFIIKYLHIVNEYRIKNQISILTYNIMKYTMYRYQICAILYQLYIVGWKYQTTTNKAWNTIFKYYWYYPYIYISFIGLIGLKIIKQINHLISMYINNKPH